MPVTLDILQRAPGEGWRCREPQDFVADLIKQLGFLNYVGIMLHHQHMGEECLGFLEMLMAMIVGHPVLRIVSFEQLDKLSGN